MDYLRAILVPFQPTALGVVAVFSAGITFFLWAATFLGAVGLWSLIVALLLNVWVLKYCYVLIEQIADGAKEPPVMDVDMLSPFETRPWLQAMMIGAGTMLCLELGDTAGFVAAVLLMIAFPATVALLAMGESVFQAMNPLAWYRVMRGLGPSYLALLAMLLAIGGVFWILLRLQPAMLISVATILICEVAFFSLIGASIWMRRRQLGFQPSRSPERTAARVETERARERSRMLDEMFEQVRIGRHVDATAPLARWLRDLDPDLAVRDSLYVAERAMGWKQPAALNPIGSTLIRHLLRFGRPDAALEVFVRFRERSQQFTMDSAPDLRTLAEYADSIGKGDLAQRMRLETPVHRPM